MFGRKRKREEENLGLSAPTASPTTSVSPAPVSSTAPSVPNILSEILASHGPVADLIAQIKADPQGFRDRMVQQAQAAGVSTFVMTSQGMAPLSGAVEQQHVDVVEELTKAADLHDKGALTDQEFEALKKKLLAE